MRDWPVRILRHLLVLQGALLLVNLAIAALVAGSYLVEGYGIDEIQTLGILILFSCLIIIPGSIFYFPFSLWLWKKSQNFLMWMCGGAGCFLCPPIILFIFLLMRHPPAFDVLFLVFELQIAAFVCVTVGCILGAAHYFLLTRIDRHRPYWLGKSV